MIKETQGPMDNKLLQDVHYMGNIKILLKIPKQVKKLWPGWAGIKCRVHVKSDKQLSTTCHRLIRSQQVKRQQTLKL